MNLFLSVPLKLSNKIVLIKAYMDDIKNPTIVQKIQIDALLGENLFSGINGLSIGESKCFL